MVNSTNGGFFATKLKYFRQIRKDQLEKENRSLATNTTVSNILAQPLEDIEADFDFLKAVVVTDENMELIKGKLMSTVAYRSELSDDKNIDYLEQFPYFFTNPELVCSK